MAISYASKYSAIVDERFAAVSLTQSAFNNDYDFEGVQTVNVYGLGTSPMNDYDMTGGTRYGVPDELGNSVQSLTMSQDRSFTFTIDRRNYEDTMMTMEAGKALSRQLNEVVIPEVDIYRLAKLVAGAGTTSAATPITNANAYESFLQGVATLLENNAPLAGAVAFISTNFYKQIRLDGAFIQASDIAQDMLIYGQVGMIERVPLIYVPSSYLPTDVEFVLSNKVAALSPQKLAEYRIHDNPPGINGWLVEGRVYYDAFVLENKKNAIYVHKSA